MQQPSHEHWRASVVVEIELAIENDGFLKVFSFFDPRLLHSSNEEGAVLHDVPDHDEEDFESPMSELTLP
jgi:hypothetical protein